MNADPNCPVDCHGQGCQYCFTGCLVKSENTRLDAGLHKVIARHDELHGITHNIMGGKMLSEEHCYNCRETAKSILKLFAQERARLFHEIRSEVNKIPAHIETERINKKMVLKALTRLESKDE